MKEQMISLMLANAQREAEETKCFFTGDLCQIMHVTMVAEKLGIKVYFSGGVPYVTSKQDYDAVAKYLIDNKIDGWWYYIAKQ